jgi:hypothetical protein
VVEALAVVGGVQGEGASRLAGAIRSRSLLGDIDVAFHSMFAEASELYFR